jgi:long-subunit acyl-CoA synthetase (AMP-forming)
VLESSHAISGPFSMQLQSPSWGRPVAGRKPPPCSSTKKPFPPAGDECYLSYLPAAHIMEFTAQLVFFCYGSQIGYACPKTISSKGACRQKPDGTVNTVAGFPYPPGAIQEFRPSMMLAVPKV